MEIDFDNFKNFVNIKQDSNISIIFPSKNVLNFYSEEIDNSDFVIRFNDFVIKGYEKHVGIKTDLVLANSKAIKSEKLKDLKCLKIAATPLYDTNREIFKFYNSINYKNVKKKIKNEFNLILNDNQLPSAGILIILFLVYNEFNNIQLFGYESKTDSENYTYYYKKDRGRDNSKTHNMKNESELIEKLVYNKKIKLCK